MCPASTKSIERPKLAIPLPSDPVIRDAIIQKYFSLEEWEGKYQNMSGEMKAISDYTGLSFDEVMDQPYSLFLLYQKDAWMYNNMRSESGRKFMKDLIRLQTTSADLQAVHAFKGGVMT